MAVGQRYPKELQDIKEKIDKLVQLNEDIFEVLKDIQGDIENMKEED